MVFLFINNGRFRRHNVNREKFHIHCDGALFGLMMPVLPLRSPISFEKPIDSIAVSGHKFLGCPMPCGITLTRKKHLAKMSEPVEYLNSIDTTIMGSRNGHAALFMWYSLKKKGTYRLHKWDNSIFSSLSSLGQSQLTVVLFRYQGAWERCSIMFWQCQVFAPEVSEGWN